MRASAPISPRPLTDGERARIERAQSRIPDVEQTARELVRRAIADRDTEILAAVEAGASQSDIARLLGMSRQAIYDAIKRAR